MLKSILKRKALKRFATHPNQASAQTDLEAYPWHTLSVQEACQKLQTNLETGLTDEQINTHQQVYGSNALPTRKPPSLPGVILDQFKNPLIFILIIAALIAILVGEARDSLFIVAVIAINTIIGTTQEWKAEKSAQALQNLLQAYTHVRRNGLEQKVPFEALVPGDIVLLESGSRVPADIRLVKAGNLTSDESLLTGESVSVEKHIQPLPNPDLPISERTNMVFAGSFITTGRATGIVIATGLQTEVGKIAESLVTADVAKTPLLIRMEAFTRRIGLAVLGATAFLGIIAFFRGMNLVDSFFLAVALAVSAIPEGLPIAMTVALSIATKRMANRKVIIRQLAAVEGLGSCTYIVTDKTGTLTVNQQTVKLIALPSGDRFRVSEGKYLGEGEVTTEMRGGITEGDRKSLERLAKASAICNEGQLVYQVPEGTWKYHGDAVDVAILAFVYKLGLQPEEIRKVIDKVGEIPYESEHRYAATFYRENKTVKVAIKGALETILPFCQAMWSAQADTPIDRRHIEQLGQSLAEEGYRVLAIAEGVIQDQKEPGHYTQSDIRGLVLLGLICMIDPLRPEVKEAVIKCRQAGIHVAMVTGDHPATALAIARDLEIAERKEDLINGTQLNQVCLLETPECIETIKTARIFARVTPLQKLQIVKTLMDLGHFVAVTGDGVNDAPALKHANIGLAMGSGSDITKEVSSIIITDDNFATIEAGVEEGRFAYGNIRKVVWFLIANGFAEVALFMLAISIDLPLPLLPVQILWANLVTSGILNVGLAFEAGESVVMRQPPRKPTESVFNAPMLNQIIVSGGTMGLVCFGAWFWLLANGWEVESARNMTLLLLVLLEIFHIFNARSEYQSAFRIPIQNNPFLVFGVIAALGIHLLALHTPLLQGILGVSPVTLQEGLTAFLLASSVLIVTEIFKMVKRPAKSSQNNTAIP